MIHLPQKLSIQDFLKKKISCSIGFLGGRTFQYENVRFKLKEIVHLALTQSSSENNLSTLLSKIRKIDAKGDKKLQKTCPLSKLLTTLRRFLGNWGFDKSELLERLEIRTSQNSTELLAKTHSIAKQKTAEMLPSSVNDYASTGKKIMNTYEKTADPKIRQLELMRRNFGGDRQSYLSFSMRGLAFIATYLKRKNNVENLFVCDHWEVFQSKLEELCNGNWSGKAALVIPTRGIRDWAVSVPESQHKATICIEKIANQPIKIYYLDSDPTPPKEDWNKSASELKKEADLYLVDTALWAISHSKIKFDQVKFYYYPEKREFGPYGCETFALKDAVAFLQQDLSLSEYGTCIDEQNRIYKLNHLPPDFMKGTQSIKKLDQYMSQHSKLAKARLKHASHTKHEEDALEKLVLRSKKKVNSKEQNHYISKHSLKYHMMLLKIISSASGSDQHQKLMEEIIKETWITKERIFDRNKEPETIFDLFEYWKSE